MTEVELCASCDAPMYMILYRQTDVPIIVLTTGNINQHNIILSATEDCWSEKTFWHLVDDIIFNYWATTIFL